MNGTAIATDPDELLVTAFHEAAHAITAAVVGVPVAHASIQPRVSEGGLIELGHVRHWALPHPNPVEAWLESTWVRAQLRILLAGYLIEDIVDPDAEFGPHVGQDHQDAWRLLYAIDPGHPERAITVATQEREATQAILADPRNSDMICDLADRLLSEGQVTGHWIHESFFAGGCGARHPEDPDLECTASLHRFGQHVHHEVAWRPRSASGIGGDPSKSGRDDWKCWDGFIGPPRRKLPMSAYPPSHKRIVYFLRGGPTTRPPKRWNSVLEALQGPLA